MLWTRILLSLGLALAPWAAGAAAPAAAPSPAAEAEPVEAAPPPLPQEQALDPDQPLPAAAPAEVATPKEDPAKLAPGAPRPQAPPSRYRFSNFALGFLGGALMGGAYGVLSSGGRPNDAMALNAALYAGGTGLVLGFAGLLLGATTPEEPRPPAVGAWPPGPRLALALRF